MRFGILSGKGIMLGDIKLNHNPDNWAQIGRRDLTNRVSIQVRISERGVGEAGILFDWDTSFFKPAPLHLVPHVMAVGDVVILPPGTIMFDHDTAERFIIRGFY